MAIARSCASSPGIPLDSASVLMAKLKMRHTVPVSMGGGGLPAGIVLGQVFKAPLAAPLL